MTKLKKAFAVVLSLILVLTIIPAVSENAETKAAETFAITSPTANQLVAAGYIDIKWSAATSSTVKDYQLYIDDTLVTTTTDTTYEYYTTKVKGFTTYVKVRFTNGTSADTEKITFGVSKKGLGLAPDMGANISLRDMGVAWYYNWGARPSSGQQYKGIEYVPMVWKSTNANDLKNKANTYKNQGYKYVLTFNEPDLAGQCDMPVDDVYNVWQGLDDVTGIKISSPVTALWPQASPRWFQTFMSKIDVNNDHDVDFISIHCYPDNYAGAGMADWFLKEVVDWTWNTYKKPIWITEFSTNGNSVTATGNNGTKEFWEAVMPELDEREYVERYAAFGFNNANTGLWLYSTGALTPGGEIYKTLGNPANFTPAEPKDPGYKIIESTRTSLLSDSLTINKVSCEDYVSAPGVTAAASSEINANSGADKAIDDNISTRWESVHAVDPQNLIIDLGITRNIKQIGIVWETASASYYTIEVSADGVNYTPVATIEDASGKQNRYDTILLSKMATGRYVKINGTSRTTDYGYSIFDIAIYGTDNTKVDETTTVALTTTTAKPATPKPTTTAKQELPTTQKTPDDTVAQQCVETTKPAAADEAQAGVKVPRTKVKKAKKNRASKKAKISIKRIKGAKKYQIQISKSKKFNGKRILVKKTVKKVKFTIKSRKIRNKKELYIRARAVKFVNGKNYYGKWSKKKKITIKK